MSPTPHLHDDFLSGRIDLTAAGARIPPCTAGTGGRHRPMLACASVLPSRETASTSPLSLAELVAFDEDHRQCSPVSGDAKGGQLRHSPDRYNESTDRYDNTRASGAARLREVDGLEALRVTGQAPLRGDQGGVQRPRRRLMRLMATRIFDELVDESQ